MYKYLHSTLYTCKYCALHFQDVKALGSIVQFCISSHTAWSQQSPIQYLNTKIHDTEIRNTKIDTNTDKSHHIYKTYI